MRTKFVAAIRGLLTIAGVSGVLACSDHIGAPHVEGAAGGAAGTASSGAPDEAAGQAGPEAGAQSDAGAGGEIAIGHCSTDAECDDGLRCNGVESCGDGACRAGTPSACSNAATCVEDTRWAPCAYSDDAPWLAYVADEDTPGVEEVYAVKESLIGKQQPIKLNLPLPGQKPRLIWPSWTRDGRWLIYGATLDDQSGAARWYAVRFVQGVPEPPIELTKGLPDGRYQLSYSDAGVSPDGHNLLLYQTGGDMYRIDLNASDPTARLKINAFSDVVQMASWVKGGGAVAYLTANQALLISPDGMTDRDAFTGFKPNLYLFASPDGSHLGFIDTETDDYFVAKVGPNEPLKKLRNDDASVYDLRFAGDGRYAAYSKEGPSVGTGGVILVDLQTVDLAASTLLDHQTLDQRDSVGGWAPDSSYLVFFGDGPEPQTKYVYTYDTAKHSATPTGYSMASADRVLGFTRAGEFLISSQRNAADSVELLAINPKLGVRDIHQNTQGKPYLAAEVAPNGAGAVFCNGSDRDGLYYVDLRDLFNQGVELAGEGSVGHCYDLFAPDSKGFVYYREATDGSRKLYWVDAAHQVLGQPIQVTREGRASTWVWQPSVVEPQ